jgi:hypothetical protein
MKLITLFFLFLSSITYAQYGYKNENVNHRFKPGFMWFYTGFRPAESEKPRKYDRLVFDVVYNSLLIDGKLINQTVHRSIGLNTNIMWDIPLNAYNGIGLGIGVQHKFQRFSPTQAFVYSPITSSTTYLSQVQPNSPNTIYQSHTIGLPIELRFRQKKWKQFKINIGGSIGYRPFVRKKEWSINKDVIFIDRRLEDICPLDYQAHVRFGFRAWAIYGSYGFSPLFKSKSSTKTTFFNFGISVSLF